MTYTVKCCDLKISAESEAKLDAELKKHYKRERHVQKKAQQKERSERSEILYPDGLPDGTLRCGHVFKRRGCPGCA